MNRNSKKLMALLGLCVAFAVVILISNNGMTLRGMELRPAAAAVALLDQADSEPLQVTEATEPRALVLYSPQRQDSLDYEENVLIALEHLRIEAQTLDLSRTQSVSYTDYDMVILASPYWEEELTDSAARLMNYVEGGGKLLLVAVPESIGTQFETSYRRMGIVDFGDYLNYDSVTFDRDLLPGLTGRTFSGDTFVDVALSVTLENNARVYAWAEDAQHRLLGEQPPQPHEEAGGHQHRDDGHEHVGEHPDGTLEAVAGNRLGGLVVHGGLGLQAQFVHDRLIDAVDQPGAKDDLVLTGVEEGTFHLVQVLHFLDLDLVLVADDNAQPGGTVHHREDVFPAAHQRDQGLGNLFFCHCFSSSLGIKRYKSSGSRASRAGLSWVRPTASRDGCCAVGQMRAEKTSSPSLRNSSALDWSHQSSSEVSAGSDTVRMSVPPSVQRRRCTAAVWAAAS